MAVVIGFLQFTLFIGSYQAGNGNRFLSKPEPERTVIHPIHSLPMKSRFICKLRNKSYFCPLIVYSIS